ncbi:transcriptional initiation protein Tat [Vibrio sp. 10N.286.49.B3]|uniref:twin-arginine translocation signal domain-containing protein n=1 Tax=Vibrio sp. 10N.286.49.B3 TaxID=1880855 RepID=UPI000C82F70D|nr:twin-arginine translocation signal domain-containing protein [Vibrio sp. 10N.286.49.B3]PMH46535.1 transcriptional initiation protein Tat [Vibrio sp. 10N.286.49.B3]
MKEKKEIDSSRRDLLKGLTTAAVVGVAVTSTTKVVVAEEIKPSEAKKSTGYHETQHIRDYYDSL